MKAPFPWFGGKSRAAHLVWPALGDVAHYVEPFAGSLASLLLRPHDPRIETVNDIDRHIANFWRAVRDAPDEVARHANNPTNEADLTARHIWLVNSGAERIVEIEGNPEYYDAKVAGWWVWGICCWIGSGWCAGTGPWGSDGEKLVNLRESEDGGHGAGVNRQKTSLSRGCGVHRKRAHLSNAGRGVNRRLVHLGSDRGVNRTALQSHGATGEHEMALYLNTLAERLRYVRVCCGDWSRVVSRGALSHGKTVGIFLDPPYDTSLRKNGCYNTDGEHGNVSADVFKWCMKNQDNPRYRIVMAGYEGEHDIPDTWRVVEWKAGRAYGRAGGETANSENRHKERLWLSPNCLGDDMETQKAFWSEE